MNELQNMKDAGQEGGLENTGVENITQKGGWKRRVLKLLKSKITFWIIGLLILGGILFQFRSWVVAAMVNGKIISRWSLIRQLEKVSGKTVLDSLITERLIRDELDKNNATASEEEIGREIEKIKEQLAKRGGTLEATLALQGITEEYLKDRLSTQKKLEKLLADKIVVTDEEVTKYVKDNKLTLPKGVKQEDFRIQVKEQLRLDKFNQEAQAWVNELKSKADIKYWVEF